MQKQLSYYKRLSQSQNTMTVIEQNLPIGGQICNYTYLGFFTKGEAATWVHVKKEEVLADKLRSWDVFKSEVEMHFFSDLIWNQKVLNKIHNFTQGQWQVAKYLDQFKILKMTSKVGNNEALYLIKWGLNLHILSLIYGNNNDPPVTYADTIKKAWKIGQNLNLNQGLLMALSWSSSGDRWSRSGVTYGRQGKPMDTSAGQTSPHCYNCRQFGHISKECTKPQREKGSCYKCGKKDHLIKDCPIAKKKGKCLTISARHVKRIEEGEISWDEDETLADESEEGEDQDFIEGDV